MPITANATAKKFSERPKRAGRRIRKYRSSNQLCGPAKRKTVTIETCNGNQLASAADRHALIISTPAKNLAVTRVRSTGRATGHTVKGMFAVRSILERTHQPGSPARQPRWGWSGRAVRGHPARRFTRLLLQAVLHPILRPVSFRF